MTRPTPLGIEHDHRGVRLVWHVPHPSSHRALAREHLAHRVEPMALLTWAALVVVGALWGLTADPLDGGNLIAAPALVGLGGWALLRGAK